jgi:hypothetical protein
MYILIEFLDYGYSLTAVGEEEEEWIQMGGEGSAPRRA